MRMSGKHRILLIDDDRTILAMYGDYLRANGFDVLTAENGEAGLAVLIEKGADVVVTDVMMAKMNGWQLLDYIRGDLGMDEVKLPVIVMSAVESVDLSMEYMRHRANDWLTKPIRPLARLKATVHKLLGVKHTEERSDV